MCTIFKWIDDVFDEWGCFFLWLNVNVRNYDESIVWKYLNGCDVFVWVVRCLVLE